MCGRYALGLRLYEVSTALQDNGMDHKPPGGQLEDVLLPSFNIAPGNLGLVYLARKNQYAQKPFDENKIGSTCNRGKKDESIQVKFHHELQVMKWGLIPSWTKRLPDYGTLLKTINCREDSLKLNKGLWNSIKATQRCVIIAQGFFEWLKKTEKIPHFIKRTDGKLLCLAGLYDCVQFEGTKEKRYTYTIITTKSNTQLEFLHDRMPVILENGSNELRLWLDLNQSNWNQDLQSLLRPFDGDLEIYPVTKDVGKLSINTPRLIIPVASSENKSNIANFFSKNLPKVEAGISVKSESKSEVTHTSPNFTVVEHEDIEIKNLKAITPPLQSPKASELGQKRKLSDTYHNGQKKKIRQNCCISSKEPLTPQLNRIKSPISNNISKPPKTKNRNKEDSKITNFFK